jgi:hypothetical protein
MGMPWRRKPERWLQYWSGSTPTKAKADGFQFVLVYCLGPPRRATERSAYFPLHAGLVLAIRWQLIAQFL